jgi:hypothetical protein
MAPRIGNWLFHDRLTKTMRRFFFSWLWVAGEWKNRTDKTDKTDIDKSFACFMGFTVRF